ncbi:MAG: phosphatase PAP2 family protein [Ignavibacteria bacterium]|nr:phosphatase PAP2 family protein [Ignavibacteria bacterium]MBK6761623.1 phosphatase PAP2 family protein [Ignavibacteria bacterium]MBK7033655.1 phosphatase PAP2 family protein [Ignavibacteria bacterium]
MNLMTSTRWIGLAILITLIMVGCDNPIESPVVAELTPTSNDSAAINWTPILVTDVPTTVIPAAPADDEGLDAVRAAVAGRTDAQRSSIRRWNQGPVQEWSAIARKIVAKYNITPAAERNPDGTFTGRFLPDPAKPLASPPFASRMFSLIEVGTYDGLIHAWRSKYTVKRPAPYVVDPSISTLAPETGLPSYPNEDAIIARVAVEMIVLMFPGERANMEALYSDATQSRVWAGVARPSDVAAGDSLARFIVTKLKERAANDKWSGADNQPAWKAKEATLVTTWPKWKSAETPARPPLHPFGGDVTPWNIPSAAAMDPGPPPSETDARFQTDMNEMRDLAKNRTREQARIATYWEAGGGTDGPPGMWMKMAEDRTRAANMSAVRSARVLSYVACALHDAAVACWYTKYKYFTARPCTIDKEVAMSAGLPNFPGYTSGHSTFSGAAAEVLSYFFPASENEFRSMASEAADSRIYSRIHVRIDCEVGLTQGYNVGKASAEKARVDAAE